MTQTTPPAPRHAPQPNAEYRWTEGKAMAFLHALAAGGKVAEAARAVGMTRQSAYRLKTRAPRFAEGWGLALAAGKARRRRRGRGGAAQPKVTERAPQGNISGQAW